MTTPHKEPTDQPPNDGENYDEYEIMTAPHKEPPDQTPMMTRAMMGMK
ncbi:MAG TPA: hypothetical protein GX017_06635 [Clostridiales bacterium]|nr:hypothetical protein [Clostridiales bacterium]